MDDIARAWASRTLKRLAERVGLFALTRSPLRGRPSGVIPASLRRGQLIETDENLGREWRRGWDYSRCGLTPVGPPLGRDPRFVAPPSTDRDRREFRSRVAERVGLFALTRSPLRGRPSGVIPASSRHYQLIETDENLGRESRRGWDYSRLRAHPCGAALRALSPLRRATIN